MVAFIQHGSASYSGSVYFESAGKEIIFDGVESHDITNVRVYIHIIYAAGFFNRVYADGGHGF